MNHPIILTVDDDVQVSNAIERDLRSQFGNTYKIIKTLSGKEALETVKQLKLRNDQIALFLTDQRMPEMDGTEFLQQAIDIYPNARRVLLTAYADTDTAIESINELGLDYYLLKPWDPPEEKLYPMLTDLLDDWRINNPPPFEGIRVVGYPWNPSSHQVKNFLARNNVPYLWLEIEKNEEANRLLKLAGDPAPDLPYLVFPDGSFLSKPENREIAERIGLQTIADQPFYDLIIVGAGPAGLAAAVYGASEGLKTLVVEQEAPGGQAGMSSRIENYLGFPQGLSGSELTHRAVSQARRFGVEILTAQKVVGMEADGPSKKIKLEDGNELLCKALLVSSGVSYRKLEANGISELTGAGIYYGAARSEGETVKDQDVYIIGGANSAGQAAIYFSRFAKTVTMLIRSGSISTMMSHYLVDQIGATENISVCTNIQVTEAIGSTRLESLILTHDGGEAQETVPASALFILIGAVPNTDWLGDRIARDSHGFILSGPDINSNEQSMSASTPKRIPYMLETSVPGVFVAGDVRHGSIKRVASAVGEGSMAVMFIHQYLNTV
jgi:thioredoxin reductase (NADPH)